MSNRAWAYTLSVLFLGAVLSVISLSRWDTGLTEWPIFLILTSLATLAQLLRVEAPNHQLYVATLVFLFAAVLVLSPFYLVLLVLIAYCSQWLRERWIKSRHLRNWYLQPFNMASQIISALAAHWLVTVAAPQHNLFYSPESVAIITAAALVYALVNHLTVGLAIVFGRGVPLWKSGVMSRQNLGADLTLLLFGAAIAALWTFNPWLLVFALAPLAAVYEALKVPQLQQQAQTDGKTGLWNARYFTTRFNAEMERTTRFVHPLAVLIADLDLLRNINNTYGHLAGDIVLAGIGRIIRSELREYDLAARFGGEEFAVALPETSVAKAVLIAERLRRAVENAGFHVQTSPVPIHVTISIGVAMFPEDGATQNELIHQADIAVYQAKLRGRNCVVCASDIPLVVKRMALPGEDRLNTAGARPFVPRPAVPSPEE